MTVLDIFEGRRYQNKNIEFTKVQKNTILGALCEMNSKELKCKILCKLGLIKKELIQKRSDVKS